MASIKALVVAAGERLAAKDAVCNTMLSRHGTYAKAPREARSTRRDARQGTGCEGESSSLWEVHERGRIAFQRRSVRLLGITKDARFVLTIATSPQRTSCGRHIRPVTSGTRWSCSRRPSLGAI